jgi:hypothetical protein
MAPGYKQMIRVEQAWRDMKSTLAMRPVFHWAPHRIHSHVAHHGAVAAVGAHRGARLRRHLA